MPTFDGRFLESIESLNAELRKHCYESYYFEAAFAFLDQAAQIAFLDPFYIDEANRVGCVIDQRNSQLRLQVIKDNHEQQALAFPLLEHFDPGAYHLFQVKKRKAACIFISTMY